MALNLSIIKSPSGVGVQDTSKTFSEQGGTLGRGEANEWVLADPDRFLSSKHCEISFLGGQYYLTDLSTNGTFINSAPEPLGKGGKIPLNDGDSFEMGDYQFNVDVSSQYGVAPEDTFGQPPAAAPDPFDQPSATAPDPFAASLDPFAPSAAPAPVSEQFSEPFSDPFAGAGAPAAGDGLSLSPVKDELDPLAALDKNSSFPDAGAGGSIGMGALEEPSLPGDPLASGAFPGVGFGDKDAGVTGSPFDSDTHSDGAGAMSQAVDWPDAAQESVIPEDWDDDLMGGSSQDAFAKASEPLSAAPDPFAKSSDPFTPPPAAEAPRPAPPRSEPANIEPPAPKPMVGGSDMGRPVPRFGAEDASLDDAEALLRAAQEPLLSERSPEPVAPFIGGEPSAPADLESPEPSSFGAAQPSGLMPEPPARPRAREPKPTQASRPQASRAAQSEQVLLNAMGINDEKLNDDEIAEIHRMVGELMPVIINGMMQILRSRASIKNEFRMNVTTIQPVENNPLKFSADVNEAIENMFVRQSSAYKKPVDAFREGFDGIGEHQVAIIAGIRSAFKNMMERFDPAKLEAQFDKQNKGMMIPGMQKTKYWNSYRDYFNGFVDNMENSFQYLFGDDFVQAYEEQLHKLVAERVRNRKSGQ